MVIFSFTSRGARGWDFSPIPTLIVSDPSRPSRKTFDPSPPSAFVVTEPKAVIKVTVLAIVLTTFHITVVGLLSTDLKNLVQKLTNYSPASAVNSTISLMFIIVRSLVLRIITLDKWFSAIVTPSY